MKKNGFLTAALAAVLLMALAACSGGNSADSAVTVSEAFNASDTAETTEGEAGGKEENGTSNNSENQSNFDDEYISSCVSVEYTSVERNPNEYKGTKIKVSGEVIQIVEGWFDTVTLRIDSGDDELWYVTYETEYGESRILEGDNITCYGTCNGVESYITVLGSQVSIPSMEAVLIELEEDTNELFIENSATIGQTISNNNGVEFCVTSVENLKTIEADYEPIQTDNNFVLLHILISNEGNKSYDVNSFRFCLECDGKEYEYYADAWLLDNYMNMDTINPGLSREYIIVYETPSTTDDEEYTLCVKRNVYDDELDAAITLK